MTIDRSDQTLVLYIEGLPARHCWPVLPDYATSDYTTTLREVSGASSRWNVPKQSASVGQWSAILSPDSFWYKYRTAALSSLTGELAEDATDTTVNHDRTNTDAGISVNDNLIVDRETLTVTTATGGSQSFTATRAAHGSELALHRLGAPIWPVGTPPALTGRLITVARVLRVGDSAASESATIVSTDPTSSGILYRGRIAREIIQARGHRVELVVQERGEVNAVEIAAEQNRRRSGFRINESGELEFAFPSIESDPPVHNPEGIYLYWEDYRLAIAVPYDASTFPPYSRRDARIVWNLEPPALPAPQNPTSDSMTALEVIWSDPAGPYPTFGVRRGPNSYDYSANPAIIALNILHSRDESGNEYDLGSRLYPTYALGLPLSRIDMTSWQDAIDALGHVEARSLWLGNESRAVDELFRALLAPWGYTAVTTRAGVWRVARLGSVYPGSTRAINAAEGRSTWQLNGRALDRVIIESDSGPDGDSHRKVVVNDLTASDWYPRDFGGHETLKQAPYLASDLEDQSQSLASSLSSRLRNLAQRFATVGVDLGPTDNDGLEVGDEVTLSDPLARDPATGLITASINGRVTSVTGDPLSGEGNAELIVLDDDNRYASYPPTAEVIGYDSVARKIETTRSRYAPVGEFDARKFSVGDQVILFDLRGLPRSATSGVHADVQISAVEDDFLTLATVFKDAVGATLTPAYGDLVSYSYYAQAKAQSALQPANYAWQAAGGLGNEDLDGDAPYIRGD